MRKRRSGVGLLAFAAVAHLASPVSPAPTVLDFEDQPPFTTVTTQYGPRGVLFQGAFVATDLGGRSGTRCLRSIPPNAEVFQPVPLVITFTSPQARVTLFANSPGMVRNGTLQAFDASGGLVAQDGPKPVAADAFTTRFEVTSPTPAIAKAVLQLENAAHFAIDDLELDGEPAQSPRPPVEVIETRQPAAVDDRAVRGAFPETFVVDPPPETATSRPPRADQGEDEPEERFDLEFAPSVERELAPGASAELRVAVGKKTGLAASVRWIGTSSPLAVALSVNGSNLLSGRSYTIGQNRGGVDLGGVAEAAGEAKLSVTNTSSTRVKVLLNLGMAPRDGS
jgi:hypothetical protein